MAREFGWRGSGAGTFLRLNVLYRENLEEKWQGYVHDDWLETRITLGTVGLVLAVGLLGLFAAAWFTSAGPLPPAVFPLFTAAALVGILIHAKWDFPFQVQSLRFMFVVMCAVLATAPPVATGRR
jgi:O-antigen ligase